MARYYLIATAIVVLLGSIVFAHRLARPDLRIVGQPSGTPKPESRRASTPMRPRRPSAGRARGCSPRLPACFDEQSRVRGPAGLAAQIPPPADRVAARDDAARR